MLERRVFEQSRQPQDFEWMSNYRRMCIIKQKFDRIRALKTTARLHLTNFAPFIKPFTLSILCCK